MALFADSAFRIAARPEWHFEIQSRAQGMVDEHVTLMTVLYLLVERALAAGGVGTRARLGQIDDAHADMDEL